MDHNITYRDIDEERLVSFCENNLTDNACLVIGVFRDTDGVWKVDNTNYAYLVKCYFEAQIVSKGKLNGKVDFEISAPTGSVH